MTNIPVEESEKLIRHIERVARKLYESKLDPAKIKAISYSQKMISAFLNCSETQAMLFSIILSLNFKKDMVSINHIASFLDCNLLEAARFLPDLEVLEKKRLIRMNAEGRKRMAMINDINFYITRDVLEAVFMGNKTTLEKKDDLNMVEFLSEVKTLIDERENEKITYNELVEDVNRLIEMTKTIPMVRTIERLDLADDEKILLYYICHESVNGVEEIALGIACDKIFDDSNIKFLMKRNLVRGWSTLVTADLVKLQDGMFRSDREVLLTDKALDLFFGEDAGVIMNTDTKIENLILPEKLEYQHLYFDTEEKKQITFLKNSLLERNYRKVCKRLKEQKMKTGMTILLYGSPGTGKTESVYQLAKATGRGILKVEICETKSMWFGDSEKRIKAVFNKYREALRQANIAPILLFNEADGVFSKRKEVGTSPVDQTENAIQNIILQELEDFEGILIATTNLTTNLDKAFERRFLYKVKFNKPSAGVRARIWRDKIQGLPTDQVKVLAEEFPFSGGQITNVARKYQMEVVLNDHVPHLEELRKFCHSENLYESNTKPIGF